MYYEALASSIFIFALFYSWSNFTSTYKTKGDAHSIAFFIFKFNYLIKIAFIKHFFAINKKSF